MQLIKITRYPVKSLQGEDISSAQIRLDGVGGDRSGASATKAPGDPDRPPSCVAAVLCGV